MSRPLTGQLGEHYVQFLCSRAGLTVNSAVADANGWDLLVEFSDDARRHCFTVDTLHAAAPQCRIQVKTSAKAKHHDEVKLTNLRRMATDPLPEFFLFLEHDAVGAIVNSYLVHIGHAWITRILERVRRVTVGRGRAHQLNRRKMTVRAVDADALAPNDPIAFRAALAAHIGSFDAYRREKLDHVANTGFEDGREVLEFSMAERDGQPSLTDAMLGRERRVRVDQFSVTLTRFGLPEPTPHVQHEDVWLEFPDLKPVTATLEVRTSPLADPVAFDAYVYQTFYDPSVDPAHHAMRIVAPFFEHEFKPFVPGFYPVHLSLARPMPLDDLDKATRLFSRLAEDPSSATATLAVDDIARPLIIGLGATSIPELPPEVREVVSHAVRIARHFGSPPRGNVLLGELFEHRRTIAMLESLLGGDTKSIRVMLKDVTDGDYDRAAGHRVVAPCAAPLGRSLYVALLVIKSDVEELDGGDLTIYSSSFRFARHLVLDRIDTDWAELRREMSAAGDPYEDENVFVLDSGVPR